MRMGVRTFARFSFGMEVRATKQPSSSGYTSHPEAPVAGRHKLQDGRHISYSTILMCCTTGEVITTLRMPYRDCLCLAYKNKRNKSCPSLYTCITQAQLQEAVQSD